MRKAIVIIGAAVVVATGMVPASSAAAGREESREYSISNGMATGDLALYWYLGTKYESFRAQPGERFVSLTITDESGQAARGHIHMDMDGNGKIDKVEDFCTKTPEPIPVRPGHKIEVGVVMGMCPDGTTPAVVTQGTITATFSG